MLLELHSPRLTIRQINPDECRLITAYFSTNETYLNKTEPVRSASFYSETFWRQLLISEQKTDFEQNRLRLWLFEKDYPNTLIGSVSYYSFIRGVFQACTLGCSIAENKQGFGLMTEALIATNRFLFMNRNFHRIMANCKAENHRSIRLLERLCFQKEGIAHQQVMMNGQWEDRLMYALVNNNWRAT